MYVRFLKRYALLALALSLPLSGCYRRTSTGPGTSGAPGVSGVPSGGTAVSSRSDSTVTRDMLPDPTMTPGATLPVTKEDICVPGYSKKVRNVPSAVKRKVYEEYGIAHHEPGEYEVDHLISLELGGSNSIRNLWPESFETQPWNAHVKDQLENKLHDMVCDGEIDLATAQREIATDWIAAYKKYFNTDKPLSTYRSKSRSGSSRSHRRRSRRSSEDY